MSEQKQYIITSGNNSFPASEYQVKIFDTIEHGVGNLIINAAAGSSKTTTIVNAIKYIPENKKVLFVAFNKDIVAEIQSRVDHKNVTISTFHSLGYNILRENKIVDQKTSRAHARVDLEINTSTSVDIIDIYKYKLLLCNNLYNNISSTSGITDSSNRKSKAVKSIYLNNIKKLVDYCRYYLAFSIKEIGRVAEIYDIVPIANEFETVRNLLILGKEHVETIDYTDMLWLPNVLNLTTKKHLYDYIFIDEAQDTSIVEQKLIEKCFKRGTRFICVGDIFQQINIWAGSTQKAIELFKEHPHTKELELPITYRCPKKVVELARQYAPNIIAAPNAIDGEINYNVPIMTPTNNDMILCRNTAPLVGLFLRYLRKEKKVYLRGFEDVKENYLSLISKFQCTLIDRNCVTADGLIPKIYGYFFSEMDRYTNILNLTEDEVLSHPSILSLYDDIQGILVLSEGLTNVNELINKINTVFEGDREDAIQLSTIHKAKGLEADNVYILCPSLMPSKFAKKDWEIESERNLIYVAYTRAKKTLNFLSEVEYERVNNTFSSTENMKKTLDIIKKKLIFNEELGVSERNYDDNSGKTTTITLGEGHKAQTTTTVFPKKDNKKLKGGIKFKNLLN